MKREEYVQMRNSNTISMELAWEFYQKTPHKSPKVPIQLFEQIFPMFLQGILMFNSTIDKLYLHYDMKFNVHKLDGIFKGQTISKYY